MGDSKKIIEDMERQMSEAARIQRCDIEDAVRVIGKAMAELPGGAAVPEMEGPVTWSWVDPRGKRYLITGCPEKDGHPMLTIRQTVAEPIAAYITSSALLLGPDDTTIRHCLTVATVNHMGAFAGYQSTVKVIVEGGALAGVEHALKMAGVDPTINSAVASVLRNGGSGTGDMN